MALGALRLRAISRVDVAVDAVLASTVLHHAL